MVSLNYVFISFGVVGQNAYTHKLYDVRVSREKSDIDEVVRIVGGNPASQGQFPYQVRNMTRLPFEPYNEVISKSLTT